MLRIFSTPNTSVSPSATINSHDASISPSMRMVRRRFIEPHTPPSSPRNGYAVVARGAARLRGVSKDGRGHQDLWPSFEARREERRAPQDDGSVVVVEAITLQSHFAPAIPPLIQ